MLFKNMSLLDITNLTDNPTKWIEDKYLDAFEEVEKELNKSITNENKRDFILNQIEYLEETMEEAKGNELLGIIDNYLVNLDYYSVVREWYQDNK
jgi:hypothetical protein